MPQALVAAASAHWLNGSVPAAIGVQAPTVPASAQDRQVPEQAVAQQTPCSQWPDRQSDPDEQVVPVGFLAQLPPRQKYPVPQSVSAAHAVLHVPAAPQP